LDTFISIIEREYSLVLLFTIKYSFIHNLYIIEDRNATI